MWGLLVVFGNRRKAFSVLTLIPVCYSLLAQTVMTWGARTPEVPGRQTVAAVITTMLLLSLAMLLRIIYAGSLVVGPAVNPAKEGTPQPQAGAKPRPQASAAERP